MATNSRLRLNPSTNLPSIHSFGELSNFLRTAVADEDCRLVSESMGHMSVHAEAVIASLRLSRQRSMVAPLLVYMLTVLRGHCVLVANLGLPWREMYEYAAYLQALNNFRVLLGKWLLSGEAKELPATPEEFELVAWRTLGVGMLMIDMYEQLTGR